MGGAADVADRVAPSGGRAVGDRERVDHRRPRAPPLRSRGRHCSVHARRVGGGADDLLDLAVRRQHLDRLKRTGSDPRALQSEEAGTRIAVLGERVDVCRAELDLGCCQHQRSQHERGGAGGNPPAPNDQVRPPGPGTAGHLI